MSGAVAMPAGPTYARCETCRFWQPRGATVAKVNVELGKMEQRVVGECHALPPLKDYTWPLTFPTDHCGAHAEAVSAGQEGGKGRGAKGKGAKDAAKTEEGGLPL